jgi:hypothetical protein
MRVKPPQKTCCCNNSHEFTNFHSANAYAEACAIAKAIGGMRSAKAQRTCFFFEQYSWLILKKNVNC